MQRIQFGRKKLIFLFILVLLMPLKGNFSWGQEFSEKPYQKVNLNKYLNYENQEIQNSQKSQTKPGLKSETKAFHLSFLSTIIPATVGIGLAVTDEKVEEQAVAGGAVFSFGIIVGPSVGYIYGGRSGRGWAGVGIRSALIVGTVLLAAATAGDGEIGGGEAPAIIVLGGVTAATIVAIIDIATVKKAVRKRNQELGEKNWMMAPKYFARSRAGGVEIKVKF